MKDLKPSTAIKILKKYEDDNEYHFHAVDRKWIIAAMEEYATLRQPLVSGSLPPADAKEFREEIEYTLSCYNTYGMSDNKMFEEVEELARKYCSRRQ